MSIGAVTTAATLSSLLSRFPGVTASAGEERRLATDRVGQWRGLNVRAKRRATQHIKSGRCAAEMRSMPLRGYGAAARRDSAFALGCVPKQLSARVAPT